MSQKAAALSHWLAEQIKLSTFSFRYIEHLPHNSEQISEQVYRSIEAGAWLPEEPFESNAFKGCRRSRIAHGDPSHKAREMSSRRLRGPCECRVDRRLQLGVTFFTQIAC